MCAKEPEVLGLHLGFRAMEAGLRFDRKRLVVGRHSDFSLRADSPEEAEALCACFLTPPAAVRRCETSGAFLNGFVSEAFLSARLRRFVKPEALRFAFPEQVGEKALFSFPLFERAKLVRIASYGGALSCPPDEEGMCLLWNLLSAPAFRDASTRTKECVQAALAFLLRRSKEEAPRFYGLTAAALTALYDLEKGEH